jgi:hypothetical protein
MKPLMMVGMPQWKATAQLSMTVGNLRKISAQTGEEPIRLSRKVEIK